MLEILDTTLRDGEQTDGVSFNANEKLAIAQILLDELKVDRIEVASAGVSGGESDATARICSWAASKGLLDRVEVLGFVDGGKSVDWIAGCGAKVINILSKGSLKHLTKQLGKTPEEHITDIAACVEYARSKGLSVNIYLEDWSHGMLESRDYVFQLMDALKKMEIVHYMLPDTLGILNTWKTLELCTIVRERYPQLKFDFHGHNDYGLAVANSTAAAKAGFQCLHCTINGLGERCGNASAAPLVAALHDLEGIRTNIDESRLSHTCRYVASITGIRIPDNAPVVGDDAYTQTSGVHADGDNKADLYANKLLPERFGRSRRYALGKLSGKANIKKNLDTIGIRLTPEQIKLVTQKVVELGDKKESLLAEDLPFIVADVLKSDLKASLDNVSFVNYSLQLAKGMQPIALLKLKINGKEYQASSPGDGQYDAFMKALWSIYARMGRNHPVLTDYHVSIPPGGKTDALVATTIEWEWDGYRFKTRGIDSDQTEAAIKATVKMLNLLENLDETIQ